MPMFKTKTFSFIGKKKMNILGDDTDSYDDENASHEEEQADIRQSTTSILM